MAAVSPKPSDSGSCGRPQGLLQKVSDSVNAMMNGAFGALGESLGTRPYTYLALTFLIVTAACTGFGNFVTENRSEKLWIPQGTQAMADQDEFTKHYNNPFRISYAIVQPSPVTDNFLSKENLLSFMDLHSAVEVISVEAPAPEDGTLTNWDLDNLCFPLPANGHPCFITSVLGYWSYDRATLEADPDVQATLQANATVDDLYVHLSGFKVDPASGAYTATGGKATYFLENRQVVVGGKYEDIPADTWEERFLETVRLCQPGLKCYRFATRSFSDEFGAAIGGDIILMNIGFLVIIVYLCVNLGKCGDAIGQRLALSMMSVLGIGMAIAASMGVSQLCGWEYTPVHSVLPFVLLGLGVDDSFVIMNSFLQTDPEEELPKRMKHAMSHAGVSITVTSVTDFVAFIISVSTSLPALASFCFYAATGILFLFLFQCIFFGAYVVIDARRQKQRRVDCCCCFTAKPNAEKDQRRLAADFEPGSVSVFMREQFGPFVVNKRVSPVIFVFALALGGLGGWGASQLTVESNQLDFIPDGSYIKTTFDKNDVLFGGDGSMVNIVTSEFDYFAERKGLYDIKASLDGKAHLQTTSGPEFVSWFHSYVEYVQASCYGACVGVSLDSDSLPDNEAEFYSNLNAFLSGGAGARFGSSVVFADEAKTSITTAKMDLKFDPKINDIAALQIEAMEEIRAEVAKLDVDAYAYTFEFLTWETFIIIRKEMISNVALCMFAVFVITLILIAHPVTALLVFVAVLFSIIEILGAMYFWGLVIDNVSVINLTLAVGLAVDYSAHVAHCFMLKPGENKQRVIESLSDIGSPVLNGAFSTFLAVVVLAFSESYVFRTLFKQFFLTCLFGVLNGMLTLPVLLVWFGPAPYTALAGG